MWLARFYDPTTKRRHFEALGDLHGTTPAAQFDEAVRQARVWHERLSRGGRADGCTVAEAWTRYAQTVEQRRGPSAAADIRARFKRHVEGRPIASIEVDKLRPGHVRDWVRDLQNSPAVYSMRGPRARVKSPLPEPRLKTAATINRDIAAMRAALRQARDDRFVPDDSAWRVELKPLPGAHGRRDVYLTREQRRALLNAVDDPSLMSFISALCVLPLRPCALAALTVADFNVRTSELRIRQDKAGAGRRLLLPADLVEVLRPHTKGKLPAAPLLGQADGRPWKKDDWKRPFKRAAAAAGLPEAAVAYSLRHSALTDLVSVGLDLVTAAGVAGTSTRMIEKHYGHLQQDRAAAALASLAL